MRTEVTCLIKVVSSSLKKGGIKSFLGFNIERYGDSTKSFQPLMIERIIRALEFHGSNVNSKSSHLTQTLHEDKDRVNR